MIAPRNFAAHESSQGKKRDAELVERLTSSDVWLKKNNRFLGLSNRLKDLATEHGQAPCQP